MRIHETLGEDLWVFARTCKTLERICETLREDL